MTGEQKPGGLEVVWVHPDNTAWRAVDACGGTYTPEQEASEYAQGHRDAITAACDAVRPVDALMGDMLLTLDRCNRLFSEIRGDWTDPRAECREGQDLIDAVRSKALAIHASDCALYNAPALPIAPFDCRLTPAEPAEARIRSLEAKLARAVEGLQRMEWACEQLASTRSSAAYEQMISDGQAQELLELDNARREARQTLAALQQEGE